MYMIHVNDFERKDTTIDLYQGKRIVIFREQIVKNADFIAFYSLFHD